MGHTETKQLNIKEILDMNLRAKALGFSTLVYKLVDGDLRIEGVDWNKTSTGEYILKIMYISEEDKDRFGSYLKGLERNNNSNVSLEIHFLCDTNGALGRCSLYEVAARGAFLLGQGNIKTHKQKCDYHMYREWVSSDYVCLCMRIVKIQVATEKDYRKLLSTIRFIDTPIELVEQGIVIKSRRLKGDGAVKQKITKFVEQVYPDSKSDLDAAIKRGYFTFNGIFDLILGDCTEAIVDGELDTDKLYEHWLERYAEKLMMMPSELQRKGKW